MDDLGEGKIFVVIRDGFRKEREAVADALLKSWMRLGDWDRRSRKRVENLMSAYLVPWQEWSLGL